MNLAHDTDDQRIMRLEAADRETVAQLAAQTIQITGLTEKVSEGFDRLGDQLTQLTATLQVHGHQLQDLTGYQGRQRAAGKWLAGVVSAVVVAVVVCVLGLRR